MGQEKKNPKIASPSLSDEGLSLINELSRLDKERTHVLISCSKTKGDYRAPAKELYRSPLFLKSRMLAEVYGFQYSILSAKHGLVAADDEIDPYDVTLKGANRNFKLEWGRRVSQSIARKLRRFENLVFFAGNDYIEPLKTFLDTSKWNVFYPLKGHSLGTRLSVLDHSLRIERRRERVTTFYTLLERLSDALGLYTLPEVVAKPLPLQGVYFFLDPDEATPHSKKLPRLVRIGTHAVSAGSKATLKNRLRTHVGTEKGFGNHRGSVFRLHVGQALIARDGLQSRFPAWGHGQSATREIIEQEQPLERQVSNYLAKLMVVYIPIADQAGIGSMRATLERHLIALLTENGAVTELASAQWLGRWSSRSQISSSGLWNVRCVGEKADLRIVEVAERIVQREFFTTK